MINLNFVKKKKFLGFFIILLGLTFSQSFAAEVIFDSTNQSYSAGDIVDLAGNIPGGIEGDIVAIEIKSPSGEVLLVRTVELGSDGSLNCSQALDTSVPYLPPHIHDEIRSFFVGLSLSSVQQIHLWFLVVLFTSGQYYQS